MPRSIRSQSFLLHRTRFSFILREGSKSFLIKNFLGWKAANNTKQGSRTINLGEHYLTDKAGYSKYLSLHLCSRNRHSKIQN